MDFSSSLQYRPEYSLPIALLSLLIYVPRVPFLINDIQAYLGCDLTYLLLLLYLTVSVDVTIRDDVANGLLHIFSALLGVGTNLIICGPLGDLEAEAWVKDLELLVTS